MNKAILISFELHFNLFFDYAVFFKKIKSTGKWWHYLTNSFIIISDKPVAYWHSQLTVLIQKEDLLLINEINKPIGGWLPDPAWSWLLENLSE